MSFLQDSKESKDKEENDPGCVFVDLLKSLQLSAKVKLCLTGFEVYCYFRNDEKRDLKDLSHHDMPLIPIELIDENLSIRDDYLRSLHTRHISLRDLYAMSSREMDQVLWYEQLCMQRNEQLKLMISKLNDDVGSSKLVKERKKF